MIKEKNCLSCRFGEYQRNQQVYCSLFDDLTFENDKCGLYGDMDDS